MTFKDDGKSSTFSSNSTSSTADAESLHTQGTRESEFDQYEKHDVKDSQDFKKDRLDSRFYYGLGLLIVFIITLFVVNDKEQSQFSEEAQLALQRKREREASQKKGPFDEA